MLFTMAEHTFAAELEYAKERRAYWQARYVAALMVEDTGAAAHAEQQLRQYDWLIGCMEGVHEPD